MVTKTTAMTPHSAAANTRSYVTRDTPDNAGGRRMNWLAARGACMSIVTSRLLVRS